MNTTEATNTAQGELNCEVASQPAPLPDWIARVSKEWALDTYRAYAVSPS